MFARNRGDRNIGLWPVRPADILSDANGSAECNSAGRTGWKPMFRGWLLRSIAAGLRSSRARNRRGAKASDGVRRGNKHEGGFRRPLVRRDVKRRVSPQKWPAVSWTVSSRPPISFSSQAWRWRALSSSARARSSCRWQRAQRHCLPGYLRLLFSVFWPRFYFVSKCSQTEYRMERPCKRILQSGGCAWSPSSPNVRPCDTSLSAGS